MILVDNIAGLDVNIPASVVLIQFGLDLNSFWRNFIVSLMLVIGLLILIFLLIVFKLKERR